MKKLIPALLICLILLSACAGEVSIDATEPAGQMQLANPWKSYDSLTDAESASGLVFPIPENIPTGYAVESYRVMNSSLLEVTYLNGDTEITVRMKAGQDPDISGVYENFTETETFDQDGASIIRKQAEDCLVYLICSDSHSFSIYATSLTADAACQELISYIC